MISVLIATKNRPTQLSQCLRSLLLNTYKNFEILVLDQSTTGKTEKYVRALKNKNITYLKLNNPGKSKALNWGISMAKGKILAFTDDDCITHPLCMLISIL